jgi:hypothetical protein
MALFASSDISTDVGKAMMIKITGNLSKIKTAAYQVPSLTMLYICDLEMECRI